MYGELHKWANTLNRYSFSEIEKLRTVQNGIYLVFEEGEKYESLDRLVRVGSHPSQGRFYKRLNDHFMKKQRRSIVRKHIGRCFLHAAGDPYISVWNLSNSDVKKGSAGEKLVDKEKEMIIEQQVSAYLTHFSVCVIPNLNNQSERMELERKLIATLSRSSSEDKSDGWLGNNHPDQRISSSGLWNIQHLQGSEFLSESDFELIRGRR